MKQRLAVLVALAVAGLGVGAISVSLSIGHVLNRLIDRLADRLFGHEVQNLPPYPNPYWAQPAWFIDPTNSSTCASDTNNCAQSTCGAVGSNQGPCLTWNVGVLHNKMGTNAPRLAQNTTLTWLEGPAPLPGGTPDYVFFAPTIAAASDVIMQCVGRGAVVGSGTITVVQSINPLANPPTDLELTFTGTAPTNGGNLIVDTTRGSQAWVLYNPTGAQWAVSQPMNSAAPPLHNNCGFIAQDNGWTTGDSVTIYATGGCSVPLMQVTPAYEQTNNNVTVVGSTNQMVIWRMVFADQNLRSSSNPSMRLGDHVQVLESSWPNQTNGVITSLVPDFESVSEPPYPGVINSYLGTYEGRIAFRGVGPLSNRQAGCIYGGASGNPAATATNWVISGETGYGVRIDGNFEEFGTLSDIWIAGSAWIGSMSQWDNADIWIAASVNLTALTGGIQAYNQGPFIFGAKIPLLEQGARVIYVNPEGGLGTFLGVPDGGIAVNSGLSTTGVACTPCNTNAPAPGLAVTQTCAKLTAANLDVPCDAGGLNGLANVPGGGGVINGVKYPNNY